MACRCTLSFRGHQDQCFGLKLLFQEAAFRRLPKHHRHALFTGSGMYRDGPYWWRQVLELLRIPVQQVGDHLWEVRLDRTFLQQVIPIFTLTTAVAGRRLRHDSFTVLDGKKMTLGIY